MFFIIIGLIIAIIALMILPSCIVITRNKQVKVIEQFGKYVSCKYPGLSFKMPAPIQKVARIIDMNIVEIQLNELTLKTKDNLFINFPINIQIQVLDPVKAAYELDNPKEQIVNYLSNFIRSEASKYDYQELYGIKDDLKKEIENQIAPKIAGFGFNIYDILVNEPVPSNTVKQSYDRVNESIRNLEAARNEAESERIKIIAKAEAEAESKRLQGIGIAQQRVEINKGMEESIKLISEALNITPQACLDFLIQINKLDTFRDMSNNKGSLVVMDTKSSLNEQDVSPILLQLMNEQKNKNND